MRRATVAVLSLLLLAAVAESATPPRRLVVTIDDLPVATAAKDPIERQEVITAAILQALVRDHVPATGFVNTNKLEVDGTVDPRRAALLQRWLDAGLELGNHTYSHPSLHRTPPEAYEADILRGETPLRAMADAAHRPLRYFRYPFLRTGRSLEIRDRIAAFLREHGYQNAPVTIDTSDWIFARAYDRARSERDDKQRRRLADEYLRYMEAKAAYYEGQSQRLFGREIPQVLLIHASMLNADNLPRLLKMYGKRGYAFVPLADALGDEAYRSPESWTGAGGISWLDRWAMARGVAKGFFAAEPLTAQWVMDYAGVDSE